MRIDCIVTNTVYNLSVKLKSSQIRGPLKQDIIFHLILITEIQMIPVYRKLELYTFLHIQCCTVQL